jgi:hypothetical protein
MEFNHVSGKNHVIGGTCSAASAAPTTTAAPASPTCGHNQYYEVSTQQCTAMRMYSVATHPGSGPLKDGADAQENNRPAIGMGSNTVGGAWCNCGGNPASPWYQHGTKRPWAATDLDSVKVVKGVVTQRKASNAIQFVSKYTVSISDDGVTWTDVDGGQEFTANDPVALGCGTNVNKFTTDNAQTGASSGARYAACGRDHEVVNNFAAPVSARFVRINVLAGAKQGWCMRAGLVIEGESFLERQVWSYGKVTSAATVSFNAAKDTGTVPWEYDCHPWRNSVSSD